MINYLRENIFLLFMFVLLGVFLLANYYIFQDSTENLFHKRIRENERVCVDRARRDKIDYRYCTESMDTAALAFDMAVEGSEDHTLFYVGLIMFLAIIGNYKTSKRIDLLEAKKDV